MELTSTDILWLFTLPAVLATVVMLATRPWRRGRDVAGWGAAAAIVGGFTFAFVHRFGGVPPFPPVSGQQWLFFMAVPVVLIALTQTFIRWKWFSIAASAIVLGITPWVVLRNVTYIPPRELWTWMIGAGVGMAGWWMAMETLARRGRDGSLPLLLGAVFGVAGLALIDAHVESLGKVAGAMVLPLVIVALAATWSRGVSLAGGGTLAAGVFLGGLLLCGRFFADLTTLNLILLALAPLAAWAGELPGLGKPDSRKRFAVRTVSVLAVLAVPAFQAATGLKATLDEQYESYSY